MHAYIASEFVVVGRDPEFADYDNPRGEIIRTAHFVIVELADGRRLRHARTFVARKRISPCPMQARAEKLCAAVNAHLAAGRELGADHWTEVSAVYGSDAYVRDGWEAHEIELERAELEREGWG